MSSEQFGRTVILEIVQNEVNKILKSNKIVRKLEGTVASVDGSTATLYLSGDTSNQTGSYINNTGVVLNVADKVYLICEYDNISQGWIALKV